MQMLNVKKTTLVKSIKWLTIKVLFPGILNRQGELIELVNGKQLLLVDGYPYYFKNYLKSHLMKRYCSITEGQILSRYCCNKASCNVYLHVREDLTVLYGKLPHNHLPSKYRMTSAGKYFRV